MGCVARAQTTTHISEDSPTNSVNKVKDDHHDWLDLENYTADNYPDFDNYDANDWPLFNSVSQFEDYEGDWGDFEDYATIVDVNRDCYLLEEYSC